MPIYEFHCPSCDMEYEERVARMGDTAPCPKCGSADVERLMSAAAVHMKGSSSSRAMPSCANGSCDFAPSGGAPPCCGGMCSHSH